jgi:antitoxin component YwqK of YwqJK toxin-antitoxin module
MKYHNLLALLLAVFITGCSGFIMDGLRKEYYPDGKLKSEINYSQAVREGMCRLYYDNGRLQASGNYRGGLKEGTWQMYNENGKLESEETYMQGKLIDQKTYGR